MKNAVLVQVLSKPEKCLSIVKQNNKFWMISMFINNPEIVLSRCVNLRVIYQYKVELD